MEQSKQEKVRQTIKISPDKCQFCWICMMRCGLRSGNTTNPVASKIKVIPRYHGAEIIFDEDCDSCRICVRHCPSGALA